jgi:hypothetical protein
MKTVSHFNIFIITAMIVLNAGNGYCKAWREPGYGEIKHKVKYEIKYDKSVEFRNMPIEVSIIAVVETRSYLEYSAWPKFDVRYGVHDLQVDVGNLRVVSGVEKRYVISRDPETGCETWSNWEKCDKHYEFDLFTSWSTGQSGLGITEIPCMLYAPEDPFIGQVDHAQVNCAAKFHTRESISVSTPSLVAFGIPLPSVSFDITHNIDEECGTARCFFDIICEAEPEADDKSDQTIYTGQLGIQ